MFMEMSTLFLKKIKKFLSLFLWLFALGNDRINEVVFQKEKSGMEGIALDKTAECKLVLDPAARCPPFLIFLSEILPHLFYHCPKQKAIKTGSKIFLFFSKKVLTFP